MSLKTDPDRIIVVDGDNRPLAVMSPEQVHLQGLRHRGFLLLLKDRHGRLVLRRLPSEHPLHPGKWDVTGSGHVGADEAAEEAAERLLPDAAAELRHELRHAGTLEEGAGTGNELVEVYEAELPEQAAQALARDLAFLLVDSDELQSLASSYPEQLSPDLLRAWETLLGVRAAS
jgi:isopentenyl-diphosphate delta-isomerase